jgi:hypothetical protein
MTELLTRNAKIKSTGDLHGERLFNFGIPAGFSASGLKTCPLAGSCAKGCYAKQGAYVWSNVQPSYEFRLQATLRPDFVEVMVSEIKKKRATIVRVHDSGDFYSLSYIMAWFSIMTALPNVKFYAYTKMVPLFKRLQKENQIPVNFTLIFSQGGLADHLIDSTTDRHSAVFASEEALHRAGYVNASDDDLVAIGPNPRIGLVYHGVKSKQFITEGSSNHA